MTSPGKRQRVALLSPISDAIGEAKAVPRLGAALHDRGYDVDLLQAWEEWDAFAPKPIPPGVNIVSLHTRRFVPFIPSLRPVWPWGSYRLWAGLVSMGMVPGLVEYIQRVQPDFLVARMLTGSATIARRLAGGDTKFVLSMGGLPRRAPLRKAVWPLLYGAADGFVAPAHGIAEAASALSGVPASRFRIIPNAVLDESIVRMAGESLEHPWSGYGDVPVVLAVGRLTRQKDFHTLVRAFARVRAEMPARLVILGEGELRGPLAALAEELGISADIKMPGFERNPYRFMRAAGVFVMSSLWEGPGHVLMEAQAVGTPVVSTDCPSGPRETLLNGEAGLLVPVGDDRAMAEAIVRMLRDRGRASEMAAVGKRASERYFSENVGREWAGFLQELSV